jgi:orotate phosphoribosyltransferase
LKVVSLTETTVADFFDLVTGRRGHFQLESGYHSSLWLDLDPLFTEPARIQPFVASLANLLRPYDLAGVCGPLLGGAFVAQLIAQTLGVNFFFTERVVPPDTEGLYQARYLLPPALGSLVRGKRIALVDDVMSAGSALRGTYTELQINGAVPVVAGALLVLSSTGADFFSQRGVPVEAAARDEFEMWWSTDCPLCAAGQPLENVAAPKSINE